MLPGRRTADGALFVTQGPPPAGTPLVGGIAVRADGTIYVSQAFTPPFDPEDLFQNNEQGAFYDPSDLSTMFQDSAGTTPVTADGQPVGLILDKSKGLVLGSELVTNGTFDSATGWTLGAGWSVVGGKLNAATTQYTRAWFLVGASAFVSGKTYRVEFDVSNYTTGTFLAFLSNSGGPKLGSVYFIGTGNGHKICYITATATVAGFGFEDESGSPPSFSIDNISVKELAGNHASQATAAKRPLSASTGLSKWTNYDATDDALNTTFPASLGSSCTVAKAVVGAAPTILTAQTIGTTWAESTDNAGLIIIDRALTGQETTDLTAWLTAKGATA